MAHPMEPIMLETLADEALARLASTGDRMALPEDKLPTNYVQDTRLKIRCIHQPAVPKAAETESSNAQQF